MQKRFDQSTVTLLCRSKLQGFFFPQFCHIATVATIYKRKESFEFWLLGQKGQVDIV
jgi:hypothetical protein